MTLINLNKLNNEQLEDRIYYIHNEICYDRNYMTARTMNIKFDEIVRIRRILKERQRNNAN
jgi:hypothetical protein